MLICWILAFYTYKVITKEPKIISTAKIEYSNQSLYSQSRHFLFFELRIYNLIPDFRDSSVTAGFLRGLIKGLNFT